MEIVRYHSNKSPKYLLMFVREKYPNERHRRFRKRPSVIMRWEKMKALTAKNVSRELIAGLMRNILKKCLKKRRRSC